MRTRPRIGALVVAALFAAWSLWPTLLPRSWTTQAVVTGVAAALGWMIGSGLDRLARRAVRRFAADTSSSPSRTVRLGVLGAAAFGAVVVALRWSTWQNAQRDEMGMASIGAWTVLPALMAAALVLVVLVALGRLVVAATGWIDRRVARLVPSAWARLTSVVVIVGLVVVGSNVVGDRFVDWADSSFGLVNEGTADGVEPPDLATVSAGPGSLVEWDDLGLQGRSFVAGATSVEELEALSRGGPGGDPVEPIRVYAGIDSADTVAARTELVMAELDRTGAFERQVLVVATATGTGWINPVAARTIEAMYGGDTAIASLQYSFFPSWVAFLVDPSGAAVGGVSLFDAVHERWSTMDPATRPLLVVFGESLGSFGAEAAFEADSAAASFEAMAARADAALLVGPTAGNPVFGQLVDDRDAGSPTWRPELDAADHVRVATTVEDIPVADATWTSPRILYLHWPTDGVGTWTASSLWRPPGWTRRTDAPGLVDATRWFPVVTWVQETADLMAGFSAVPGFGHDYTNAFTSAWAAVVPPGGWSEDDTAVLDDRLSEPAATP